MATTVGIETDVAQPIVFAALAVLNDYRLHSVVV
jgi:hypothetical protein